MRLTCCSMGNPNLGFPPRKTQGTRIAPLRLQQGNDSLGRCRPRFLPGLKQAFAGIHAPNTRWTTRYFSIVFRHTTHEHPSRQGEPSTPEEATSLRCWHRAARTPNRQKNIHMLKKTWRLHPNMVQYLSFTFAVRDSVLASNDTLCLRLQQKKAVS
jgi:hypothetical protein